METNRKFINVVIVICEAVKTIEYREQVLKIQCICCTARSSADFVVDSGWCLSSSLEEGKAAKPVLEWDG
ncbi:hypothetical protein Pyn_40605 [Prunus yedoensis var. nudiflora]|uniref:Uncharacterized protein n=1 Tax=Prunus yedoensis var. nudiflora TaxID=2094558 RepID=A0A314YFA1_PRUYE|nr:hypothetical protein Pyn_40605 [Prunus yedoensis var. nudiflora]